MFAQIENRKGEKLYIITILSTNNVMPHTIVNTWEECRNKFEMITKELDNSSVFAQLIHKKLTKKLIQQKPQ